MAPALDRTRVGAPMTLHLVVAAAVAAVVVLGVTRPWPPDPVEVIWTTLGAGGTVYAAHVFRRRWLAELWRRRENLNGLIRLIMRGHLVLRGLGFIVQLLMLFAGIGAMLNWNRLILLWTLIGVAALTSLGSWYAERTAREQELYYRRHPEE